MRRLLRPAFSVALLAFIARVDPALAVAAVLAAWAWSSWSLPARAVAGLSGHRTLPQRVLFGEPVDITLTIRAERGVAWLDSTDAVPFDLGTSTRWVTSLRRGEERVHRVQLTAMRRGLHRIGPTVVAGGDPFGLRHVQRTLIPAATVLVYPRIVPIETLTAAAGAPLPMTRTRASLFEDPTRMIGVRDYRPGDAQRKIHWTASASAGTLLVKQHGPAIAREVVLVVDLARDSHPMPGRRRSAEIAVTAAASVLHHLATVREEAVGIRIVGRDTPTGESTVVEVTPGRDPARVNRMLEHLARSDVSGDVSLEALLLPAGINFGSSVVVLTGAPSRAHVLGALRLIRLGVFVSVVTTAGERHRSPWERRLTELGISVRSVDRLADLVAL